MWYYWAQWRRVKIHQWGRLTQGNPKPWKHTHMGQSNAIQTNPCDTMQVPLGFRSLQADKVRFLLGAARWVVSWRRIQYLWSRLHTPFSSGKFEDVQKALTPRSSAHFSRRIFFNSFNITATIRWDMISRIFASHLKCVITADCCVFAKYPTSLSKSLQTESGQKDRRPGGSHKQLLSQYWRLIRQLLGLMWPTHRSSECSLFRHEVACYVVRTYITSDKLTWDFNLQ